MLDIGMLEGSGFRRRAYYQVFDGKCLSVMEAACAIALRFDGVRIIKHFGGMWKESVDVVILGMMRDVALHMLYPAARWKGDGGPVNRSLSERGRWGILAFGWLCFYLLILMYVG